MLLFVQRHPQDVLYFQQSVCVTLYRSKSFYKMCMFLQSCIESQLMFTYISMLLYWSMVAFILVMGLKLLKLLGRVADPEFKMDTNNVHLLV